MDTATESAKKIRAVKRRMRRQRVRRGMALLPLIILALAILVCAVCFPILQVFGNGMSPALSENDVVIVLRSRSAEPGQIVAFECDGQILLRRVIAGPGSTVSIDTDGNVAVDGTVLDEPYAAKKDMGICSVDLPMQIPDGQYFVLGDNREFSLDSRSSLIGCVPSEKLIGRVILTIPTGELPLPWLSEKP